MSQGAQLSGYIQALEPMETGDVRKIFIASVCVLAIECQCDPQELLSSLGDALLGEWDEIREVILMRQFEQQMQPQITI